MGSMGQHERFTFTANHYLQPGDYVKLCGGNGDCDGDGNGHITFRSWVRAYPRHSPGAWGNQ